MKKPASPNESRWLLLSRCEPTSSACVARPRMPSYARSELCVAPLTRGFAFFGSARVLRSRLRYRCRSRFRAELAQSLEYGKASPQNRSAEQDRLPPQRNIYGTYQHAVAPAFSFVDNANGWITLISRFGAPFIEHTVNGGKSWDVVGQKFARALRFWDHERGYAFEPRLMARSQILSSNGEWCGFSGITSLLSILTGTWLPRIWVLQLSLSRFVNVSVPSAIDLRSFAMPAGCLPLGTPGTLGTDR